MNVTDSLQSNTTFVRGRRNDPTEDPQSLKKAIKAYQDEYLTGLTEEELEEIKKRTKEYLKENPVKDENDREALEAFIKSLLKKFGFKGDIDEHAKSLAASAEQDLEAEHGMEPSGVDKILKTEGMKHFEHQGLGGLALKMKLIK